MTGEQRQYTIHEAATFLGRDEQFVRAHLADGTLAMLPGMGITWNALIACLETYNPHLAAVIRIAQDSVDNGEYDISLDRLRDLGIVTSSYQGDEESGTDIAPTR
jgi:hypothetical protein